MEPVLWAMKKRILNNGLWQVFKASKMLATADEEPDFEEEQAGEELKSTLEKVFSQSKDDEFRNTIKIIVGQVIAKKLPIEYVAILGKALWEINQVKQEPKIFHVLSDLKGKSVQIFRAALSGGEFCHYAADCGYQYYSLSPIPDRIRAQYQITFAVSRKNTGKISEAYTALIEESKTTGNQQMAKKWEIERDVFMYLVERVAPKLLEPAPQATEEKVTAQ